MCSSSDGGTELCKPVPHGFEHFHRAGQGNDGVLQGVQSLSDNAATNLWKKSRQVITLGWYGDRMKARAAHSLFWREDVATPWTSFLFAGHAKCEHEH